MKKILLIASIFVFSASYAQIKVQTLPEVAVTNQNPFLDASGYTKRNPKGNSIGKGLYFPQTDLTKWEFKTDMVSRSNFVTAFDGMVVYNTGTGKTLEKAEEGGIQVDVKPGFYYFSNPNGKTTRKITGGKWVRIADTNDLANGVAGGKYWSLDGNANTTEAKLKENTHEVESGNYLGTQDDKSLTFATKKIARLVIGKEGGISERVGGTDFNFALKVYGKAKFDKGIVTSASTYPDYVFDHYFTGKSAENPNYQFKSLSQVEKFIKENNHLPGVTSIKDLTKADGAYEVDNTQLSIQTLEKVEELYLHIIEQQKEIESLKAELQALKK